MDCQHDLAIYRACKPQLTKLATCFLGGNANAQRLGSNTTNKTWIQLSTTDTEGLLGTRSYPNIYIYISCMNVFKRYTYVCNVKKIYILQAYNSNRSNNRPQLQHLSWSTPSRLRFGTVFIV